MNTADTIAIYAAGFAGFAALVSVGAWWSSKRALDLARSSAKDAGLIELERIRLDLLNDIADNRALLERARIEIGAIRAKYELEPPPVKEQLHDYVRLFNETLPQAEKVIKDYEEAWTLWVSQNAPQGYRELMNQRALLHRFGTDLGIQVDSLQRAIDDLHENQENAQKEEVNPAAH